MFTFYHDPGHGWLKVSIEDLKAVGVSRDQISDYSYHKPGFMLLEEDCDAGVFVEAYKRKHGTEPEIREQYIDDRRMIGI